MSVNEATTVAGPGTDRLDLTSLRVLIAEDEAMIAMDIEMTVESEGGIVVGPFPQLGAVLKAVAEESYDVAILDIMLGREEVYPAAEIVAERGIGFIFHSGHATGLDLKARFPGAPVCSKPAAPGELVRLLLEVHASARTG